MAQGAICHLDHASIEWHKKFLPAEKQTQASNIKEIIVKLSTLPKDMLSCKAMTIDTMDDETYRSDRAKRPDGCTF